MKKLGLALFLLLGFAPAQAQNAGWPPPGGAQAILCVYNTTDPVLTNGQDGFVQCDVAGRLLTTTSPTPSPTAATTRAQTAAAASSLVAKATAGNLYDFEVNIGATSGYVMLFNATSAPVDGAVTPAWCVPITSNGTNGSIAAAFPTPMAFATGITIVFSTTGCYSKTASSTGVFIAAGYK